MTRPSIIAAIVHEALNTKRLTDYTDLVETVKVRCARLRIPYDSSRVTDAIRLVERTRRVPSTRRLVVVTPPRVWRPAPPISRREATAILASLGIRR